MDGFVAGWISILKLPQLVYVVLLSLLIPLSIFVGRRNMRVRRIWLLESVQKALSPASNGAMPASFTAIEARYRDRADGAPVWIRAGAWIREIGLYILPTLVFILVSGCGFALLFALGGDWLAAAKVLLQGLQAENGAPGSFTTATALIMGAAFVGAYIWSVNYLILRIANFDLSPISFLSTSAHILITVFAAWVLRQVIAVPAPEAIGVAILLGIAFLSGLYPSLGVNVLVDRLPAWLRFKREVAEASQIKRSFPLDLIDGIDTTIKFRLNGLDVTEVQNLATANPIELFVETPYGFGQIFDWMAQAQVLAELGPQRFVRARDAGIRDMKCVLDLSRTETGRALLKPFFAADTNETDDALHVRIDSIANKLHVRQLAQWTTLLARAVDDPPATDANHPDGHKP